MKFFKPIKNSPVPAEVALYFSFVTAVGCFFFNESRNHKNYEKKWLKNGYKRIQVDTVKTESFAWVAGLGGATYKNKIPIYQWKKEGQTKLYDRRYKNSPPVEAITLPIDNKEIKPTR